MDERPIDIIEDYVDRVVRLELERSFIR